MLDIVVYAAIGTAVTVVIGWSLRRLGKFGARVLQRLDQIAELPQDVKDLRGDLHDAVIALERRVYNLERSRSHT